MAFRGGWSVSIAEVTAHLEHRTQMFWDGSICKPPLGGLAYELPDSTIKASLTGEESIVLTSCDA